MRTTPITPSPKKDEPKEHNWVKSCLVTQRKGGMIFDSYRCDCCGVTGKRFGFGWPPKLDDKFKNRKSCAGR